MKPSGTHKHAEPRLENRDRCHRERQNCTRQLKSRAPGLGSAGIDGRAVFKRKSQLRYSCARS